MRTSRLRGVDILEHKAPGYQPLIWSDGNWMAALMNGTGTSWSIPAQIEQHPRTDELFVLVAGRAVMVVAGNACKPGKIQQVAMQRQVLYNVRAGTWHITPMTKNAKLVIIERKGTNVNGSILVDLSARQRQAIKISRPVPGRPRMSTIRPAL